MENKKTKSKGLKRRSFIKKTAVASSLFIVPRNVLGGLGYTAPSDQLAIAAIGAGGQGGGDIRNASVNGRGKNCALCDVDFSGSASRTVKKFPKAKLYSSLKNA